MPIASTSSELTNAYAKETIKAITAKQKQTFAHQTLAKGQTQNVPKQKTIPLANANPAATAKTVNSQKTTARANLVLKETAKTHKQNTPANVFPDFQEKTAKST